ncbi:cupin domain-containing protein [uncultured Ralstonia sp.]|jgi:predicted cupin superfamily sugar epimerase|uniref:cupin domain-containing protein n=1 Tax=Ralstonia sp. TaxID=54061 RepID=UPI001EAA3DF7|nr:cupin domain-containing protein [uncultured Ralstonia sp.]UCF24191.1 MAG: cupin domain-containing protein [Ralstonia sp.]
MPIAPAAQRLITRLGLAPHPEGGFYRETYRSEERIQRGMIDGPPVERAAATAIYYLLADDAYSAWHRIQSDELWHFHAGDVLDVHVLEDHGAVRTHRLGHAAEDEMAVYQAVVPAGHWFAAERIAGAHGYTLVGCTVAPGFEFSEFELAEGRALLEGYAAHDGLIRRLLPKPPVR